MGGNKEQQAPISRTIDTLRPYPCQSRASCLFHYPSYSFSSMTFLIIGLVFLLQIYFADLGIGKLPSKKNKAEGSI
jgi:hypothetical protein